ncbi:MAG: signal recognition particle-docking protein FtsY [Bacteroidales bacterium]|nr:signal recognition particle-docking protein FtsY [Bacteroidales bacterium]
MGLFDFLHKKTKEEERQTLDQGIAKTKESLFQKLTKSIIGKSTVDDAVLDDLEETLITSDVGVDTTLKVIDKLQQRIKRDKYISTTELNDILRAEISQLLRKPAVDGKAQLPAGFDAPLPSKPYVILVVGVNGVGKTTTIAKLAYQYKLAGRSVVLGAADTFRAAAVEQLMLWADRVEVPIVQQGMGADPASVAYDTLQSAIAHQADVVIIDTAGRLHNKVGLMNELGKIRRVMQKLLPDAPHEVLLVLDASTGQNAIEQARQFTQATDVNALALTKLDGTAKGGVIIGISDQFNIPVRYIGLGEKMTDLQLFNPDEFVDSLFA